MARFEIAAEASDSEDAEELIGKLNEELGERYPEPDAMQFGVDADEVTPGRSVFLMARLDDDPVGCAVLRQIRGSDGEIQRMYVDGCVRGRGYARALLRAVEVEGRALGVSRLVLETGVRQPEAIGLYESAGFERIEAVGERVESPLSVWMAKELPISVEQE